MRITSKSPSMGPPIVSNHPDFFGEIVVLQKILSWVLNWSLRMLPYRVRLWNRALLASFRVTPALVMFQFSIATETGWAVEPVILSSVINASPKARLTLPPTALASSRSEPIDLSGQWSWKGAWRAGDALPEESNTGWFSIQIPSEYEQKGMKVDQKAALYRTCVVPETWRGNRVKMRFDAVNNAMTLRINGVEVGKHDGFLLPFEFDVTDHLRFGSTNQILVELVELGVGGRGLYRLRDDDALGVGRVQAERETAARVKKFESQDSDEALQVRACRLQTGCRPNAAEAGCALAEAAASQ
jgi:hypothetical protein